MTTKDNVSLVKISKHFECKICNYITSRKFNLELHNNSIKHRNNVLATNDNEKLVKISKTNKIYECEKCDKKFNDRAGLWRHKKKCAVEIGITNLKSQLVNEEKQQQLIEYLLKENSEFKIMMLEMIKNAGNNNSHNTNNNNTTNNNTTNNSFNLQFYLNETCKNAMNIMDFVSQLQVGIDDLEETGRLGFAEGISKIFINGLKQISVNDRPLHCSDLKRETLYVKNNNEWTKENDDKTILTNAIKHVAYKNMKQITEWTKDNPEYNDPDSKVSDKYQQIVSESMSGSTKEETNKNYNKIIKNIVKESVIDK